MTIRKEGGEGRVVVVVVVDMDNVFVNDVRKRILDVFFLCVLVKSNRIESNRCDSGLESEESCWIVLSQRSFCNNKVSILISMLVLLSRCTMECGMAETKDQFDSPHFDISIPIPSPLVRCDTMG